MRVDSAILALALGCVSLVAHAQLPAAKTQAISRLATAYMAKYKVPGMSIAIVADGTLAWSEGYGLADIENQVPAKPGTVYRTASIGKTMTATAAMQLVEQGKLALDAEVQKYCPAFPAKDYPLTTRHLISHLGGIRHYGGPRDAEEQASAVHYDSVVASLAPFKNDPLAFRPGTKFLYTTYGYTVLGCVIEGASGVRYLDYMKRNVWDPAGMSFTRDDDPFAIIANRAAGYTMVEGQIRNAIKVDMSNKMPAGGFVTTVGDLAKFAMAVMQGRLVRPETFERMITPAVLADGKKVHYGMGWSLEEWKGDMWSIHGGSTPGVSGFLALMPRHRFAVAILANEEDLPERNEFAESIARVVLDFPPPAATPR
jgi:CubicO group peptidase (beta-lactamase class C family)